ncbi:MAG: hypothetical protein ACE5HN_07815 [Nitrospiria bacterium]
MKHWLILKIVFLGAITLCATVPKDAFGLPKHSLEATLNITDDRARGKLVLDRVPFDEPVNVTYQLICGTFVPGPTGDSGLLTLPGGIVDAFAVSPLGAAVSLQREGFEVTWRYKLEIVGIGIIGSTEACRLVLKMPSSTFGRSEITIHARPGP